MNLPATLSKSSTFEEYAAMRDTTISGSEQVFQKKPLQLVNVPAYNTCVCGNPTTGLVSPTGASQFVTMQRVATYEEYLPGIDDTSGWSACLLSPFGYSSLEEVTNTSISTKYDFSGRHYGLLRASEMQLLANLVIPPSFFGVSRQTIQKKQVLREEEEQEAILADTNRALSFEDLLYALNRISRPTPVEMEDISLSVDPDDYPIV